MTSSPELPVPDAALRRHDEPARPNLTDDDLRARLARIAAPIVAAELRRLATVYDGVADGYSPAEAEVVRRTAYAGVSMKLRARADEIERQQQ